MALRKRGIVELSSRSKQDVQVEDQKRLAPNPYHARILSSTVLRTTTIYLRRIPVDGVTKPLLFLMSR